MQSMCFIAVILAVASGSAHWPGTGGNIEYLFKIPNIDTGDWHTTHTSIRIPFSSGRDHGTLFDTEDLSHLANRVVVQVATASWD